MANQGFANLTKRYYTQKEVNFIMDDYLNGISQIEKLIKQKKRIPVIASVYPHSDFDTHLHNKSLAVRSQMEKEYPHFIDFYTHVHQNGTWGKENSYDAGHTNDFGYLRIYQQINVDYLIQLIKSIYGANYGAD